MEVDVDLDVDEYATRWESGRWTVDEKSNQVKE